ncbi:MULTISPECIES: hypothetical protein [unclassified Streptomyces]|uniref:hypothetical protein n=1 Tax=unclassified Streptomyces TaxID=2593676 RepID=UPI0035D8457C
MKLQGTRAEEEGGGKVLMLERGAFDDVTVAMMVHPAPLDVVDPRGSTDMGNITHAMSLSHPAIGVPGTQGMPHTRQFAEEVSGAAGDEMVLDGALAMAWTGLDLAADPQWRTRCAASRHG